MLRVGLTGGVASGKSTLASMLAARGAAVLDADAVVETLYAAGGAGAAAVAALFGNEVLAAGGAVDRARLAERVLGDAEARSRLEAAIHPLVRHCVSDWLAALVSRPDPPRVAVIEAALLVESGAWREYDRLVVVTADEGVRRARALAGGWPPERFDRVLAAQTSDAAREAVAHFVVRNDGAPAELRVDADELWDALLGSVPRR